MYGGHITDDWDRRLCRTYLEEFIKPEMMEGELYLAPGFLLPGNMDYNGYHQVNAPPATSFPQKQNESEKSLKGCVPGVIFAERNECRENAIKPGYCIIMHSGLG